MRKVAMCCVRQCGMFAPISFKCMDLAHFSVNRAELSSSSTSSSSSSSSAGESAASVERVCFKCPGCKKTFSSEQVMRQHAQAKNHRAPQPSKKRKKVAAVQQEGEEAVGIIHPFEVDPDDHCETPPVAYQHIAPILNTLAKGLGKEPSELEIYDPYFCAGGVIRRLGDLGFTNVYNKCEDCYAMWDKPGALPDFDAILTNPPYSEDHMQRIVRCVSTLRDSRMFRLLLGSPFFLPCSNHYFCAHANRYCAESGKPWFLLMPNYVASKPYYSSIINPTGLKPFYLCPVKRYTYLPPKGLRLKKASSTQKKTSPFVSFWYCCGVDDGTTNALAQTPRPTQECRLARSLDGLEKLGLREDGNGGGSQNKKWGNKKRRKR